MKIALIFSGHMRMYEDGFESFKKYLIDPLGRDVFDIFIHTWSDIGFYTGRGYLKPRSDGYIRTEEDELGFYPTGNIDKEEIFTLYNPIDTVIDEYSLYNDVFKEKSKHYVNAYTRPKNTLSQFYKVMMGCNLVKEHSEQFGTTYDLVIRTRPDLVLQGSLPEIRAGMFYTNRGGNSRGTGIGDQLHISSYEHMMKFSRLYEHTDELYDKLGYSCPHSYSQLWLETLKIPFERIDTPAFIMHGPFGPYREPDTGQERPYPEEQ